MDLMQYSLPCNEPIRIFSFHYFPRFRLYSNTTTPSDYLEKCFTSADENILGIFEYSWATRVFIRYSQTIQITNF